MAIHDVAARFYREQVSDSWVPGYLAGRGIGAHAQRRWLTGYAPAESDVLVRHLRAAGYPDTLIQAAGLARRSRRGFLTDTFRDRAVLPIRSPRGTIVAFIGRAAEHAGQDVPKYLNSPGTCLYDKGRALFGLWQARDALAAGAIPVITEGPLDAIAIAIAADLAGSVSYAPVALCGSAITARQVESLAEACDLRHTGVLVALDNDTAGQHATVRAYRLLSRLASRIEAVDLAPASDPAQVLRDHGPAELGAALACRRYPLADLVIDASIEPWSRWLGFAEGQIGALRAAAGVVASMPPPDVGRQVARIAARLDLSYAIVTTAVTDALTQRLGRG
ncbi:MAG TPA: toprim domain-containing protein [Streptosporangiaceae bacterium]|nr:toprim domain-containing protein [Streptosporangiaceae bacterium]